MSIVVFDATGRCKYVIDGDETSLDLSGEAAAVVTDYPVDPNSVCYDFYWQKMRDRSQFYCVITNNRISNLPHGTTVIVGSDQAVVTDGLIEFEVSYPQTITAVLLHPNHITKTVEVPCEVQG